MIEKAQDMLEAESFGGIELVVDEKRFSLTIAAKDGSTATAKLDESTTIAFASMVAQAVKEMYDEDGDAS